MKLGDSPIMNFKKKAVGFTRQVTHYLI
jgi:hypothetical protein